MARSRTWRRKSHPFLLSGAVGLALVFVAVAPVKGTGPWAVGRATTVALVDAHSAQAAVTTSSGAVVAPFDPAKFNSQAYLVACAGAGGYWNWYYCNDPDDGGGKGCTAYRNGTCGEYGVDVPLPGGNGTCGKGSPGTPIYAPETGTVRWDARQWVPNRVLLYPDASTHPVYPGLMGFGHVCFVAANGAKVTAGTEIATVGCASCYGKSWGDHVEFMYSPSQPGNIYDQSAYTGGCSGAAYPCGWPPSKPLSGWSVLAALETGAVLTPPVVTVASRSPSSIKLSWTEPGHANSYEVIRDGIQIATTTTRFYTDMRVGSTSHRYEVIASNAYATAASVEIAARSSAIAFTFDVTGNGRTDLVYVVPGRTSYIDTFLSNGNGTYTEAQTALGGLAAASGSWLAGDFDNDGKDDLAYVVSYKGCTYIDTFLARSSGKFVEQVPWTPSGGCFAPPADAALLVAKASATGGTDIVYIVPGPATYVDTFAYARNGTYTETMTNLGTGFDATSGSWLTGDLNNDGAADIAYSVRYKGCTFLDTFLSNRKGSFVPQPPWSPGGCFTPPADSTIVTGKSGATGGTDLLYVIPGASPSVDAFAYAKNGTYVETTTRLGAGFDAAGGSWLTADLNNDGRADLAYVVSYKGCTYIDAFLSDGSGTFAAQTPWTPAGCFAPPAGSVILAGKISVTSGTALVYVVPGSTAFLDTFFHKTKGGFQEINWSLGAGFAAFAGEWG
jgi:hypothetical protein